jgi:hypothetical protein
VRLTAPTPRLRPAEAGRLARIAQEWNVNIHYDARLAACVPARAAAVLNVGCGDGQCDRKALALILLVEIVCRDLKLAVKLPTSR